MRIRLALLNIAPRLPRQRTPFDHLIALRLAFGNCLVVVREAARPTLLISFIGGGLVFEDNDDVLMLAAFERRLRLRKRTTICLLRS